MTQRRVQVVTGGTSGMGLETAKALKERGPVLVGGRSEKRMAGALEELKAAGVEAYGKACDVSDRASVEAFRDYALELGQIGGVVNAAGVDFDNATIEQVIDINMVGTINVTEAFLPYLDNAVLMNYSSVTGYFYQPTPEDIEAWNDPNAVDFAEKAKAAVKRPEIAPPDLNECFPYYAASKRFVMHYTMANALRFGKRNSRVLSIAPGAFDTPMYRAGSVDDSSVKAVTAFQRLGKPEEMAALVAELMSPRHAYLTGCDVIHDGGKTAMTLVKQLA